MSKNKAPSMPSTPSMFIDPTVGLSTNSLYNTGARLTSGDISNLPTYLQDTVNTNPEVTRLTLQGLQAQLEPELRRTRADVVNQLEANNQLTGSTTASALGNIQSDYESRLVAAGAEAGLNDINRAFANRVSLFGTGLNAIQAAGTQALGNQSQVNSFNLDNYQNQVAKVLGEQKQNKGGLTGALTGGLGGAMAGSMLGPMGMIAGGLGGAAAGGFGAPGTGGQILGAGSMVQGMRGLGQGFMTSTQSNPMIQTASNSSSVFGGESIMAPASGGGGLVGSLGKQGGYWPNALGGF